MEALVEAAVSEVSRLLDRCSPVASHVTVVIKEEHGITEEVTGVVNPLTSTFASLMETWTKEAVEKIATMLRTSLAEDGSLENIATPRRAKAKTAHGPVKYLPTRRTSGRTRCKKGGSERLTDVDQVVDDVTPEGDIAAPRVMSSRRRAMTPPPAVPGHAADGEEEGEEEGGEEEEAAALEVDPVAPPPGPDATGVKPPVGGRPGPIQCPACEKTFAIKCRFDRHFVTHSKPHLCSLCGKRFSRARGLEAHARRHTGESRKPYRCAECGTEFAYKSTYNRHARRHAVLATRVLTCAFCEGRFAGALSLQRHACAAVATTFLCPLCPGGGAFGSGRALAEHEDAMHAAAPRDFVCEVCGRRYLSAASLCAHRAAHLLGRGGGGEEEDEGEEACRTAPPGPGGGGGDVLRGHPLRRAGAEEDFVCGVCGKACSHRSGLKHHMLTHTGERAFVCETCGKRCSHASALQNHTRVHTGQKAGRRPVCDVCGKLLSSMAKLRYHMSLHRDERPYPCDRCGKSFRNPSNLRKHAASHAGAKPYGCAICGRRFKGAPSLRNHGRRHAGQLPFGCAACGEQFGRRAQLRGHQLEAHATAAAAAAAAVAVPAGGPPGGGS